MNLVTLGFGSAFLITLGFVSGKAVTAAEVCVDDAARVIGFAASAFRVALREASRVVRVADEEPYCE